MEEETWVTEQVRPFTHWINSVLEKGQKKAEEDVFCTPYNFSPISDIFQDLRNGVVLIHLFYVLTGKKFKYTPNPRLPIHKLENIEQVLSSLKDKRVNMVNIGSADIHEGNKKITLGLVWRLIRMTVLAALEEDEAVKVQDLDQKILDWCKQLVGGYPDVNIKDFGPSWADGLAISAMVHSQLGDRKNLFDYKKGNPLQRTTRAIKTADTELGVPAIIEPADMVSRKCDKQVLFTYLSGFYLSVKKKEDEEAREKKRVAEEEMHKLLDEARKERMRANLSINQAVESFERQKQELDIAYAKVRDLQAENFHNGIASLLVIDRFQRKLTPYTAYSIDTPIGVPDAVGMYDSSAFFESLGRYYGVLQTKNGIRKANPDSQTGNSQMGHVQHHQEKIQQVLREVLRMLSILPQTVSFSGAHTLLLDIVQTIPDEMCGVSVGNLGSRPDREKEELITFLLLLSSISSECKSGIAEFKKQFHLQLKHEKQKKLGVTSETQDPAAPLPLEMIPAPSEYDLKAFGDEKVYRQVVAEEMVHGKEGSTKMFAPILQDEARAGK